MKTNKTLIIDLCNHKNSLHHDEFVKPIEDIVEQTSKFKTTHFTDLKDENFNNYKKIILCGVALKDYEYLNHIEKFTPLKQTSADILGICAGAHILGLLYDSKLKQGEEIGLIDIKITKQNKLFDNIILQQTYALHSSYIEPSKEFETLAKSKLFTQISKHKNKNIYAILFHPEVRNKKIITNFLRL
jgi:GMP synthase (glutamine-hydrolysing)